MEPFKNLISPQVVRDCAEHLSRAWPQFDRKTFERLGLNGLERLEFKARAEHLCNALEATLPSDFAQAAAILEASLAPAPRDASLDAQRTTPEGLAGWALWPLTTYIARHGLNEPRRALEALHAMTQRFTAEFAIRPFIAQHPQLAFAMLERWTRDPSAHVRRLVSEGSRPRLPWGMRLPALVADPSRALPLLAVLQDDPSEYVRRSVANHLNDIAKDHADLVADWVARHLVDASAERRALLRHASRTLIKSGHTPTLRAWGLAQRLRGGVQFELSKRRVAVGGSIELRVSLTSNSARRQSLAIDYVVHHVRANGRTSPKAFKGWTLTLDAGESRDLHKAHSLREVTTRRYHPGTHVIELRVNGRTEASTSFELRT